jgi:signal transduction histidine kinase
MAPFFIRRRLKANLLFFIYFTVSSLLLVLIFGRVFPDCFLPGQGLTPFKVASEYIISILLAISLWLLIRSRGEFDVRVLRLIAASIFVTILSEMCFTLYKDVYDALNLTGHFLKTISFYLIYKAIVETGLVSPYDLLYRNLKTSEASLKKTADQLISANRELEQFAFVASHDLRAPLRGIQGFSQALLEDYSPKLDLTGQDYARRILDAAQRMDTLVEKLLAYSRLCRAEIDLKPQSLEQVISEVLSRLAMDIGEKQAQVELAGPWPEVQGHFPTLVQVVANLVANAIKFAAPGQRPQVRLWAEAHDARVRLWVEDKGIGVAPEDQKRIFRIFEALHGEETYPGEGIGLAIVRKGVERLGGQAGVESVPGAGSRFWIELPAPH